VRGNNIKNDIDKYDVSTKVKLFSMDSSCDEIINYIISLNNYTIIGIGNIVGWGDTFLEKLKNHKV
jgi:hypothetical protein